jgi:hypothetical protein
VLVGLAATVACFGAPLVPAFASQLQTARTRAAALLARAQREAYLVHDLTVSYQEEAAQAGFWHEEAATAQATARSLAAQSDTTEALLQDEAVMSYADSVPSDSPAASQAADFVETADREAYMVAAVGDLSTTLARFDTERSGLAATIATAKKDWRDDVAAEKRAAAARGGALKEAAALQVMLSETRSAIAALSARERASTGPPVGNGIVKALTAQLGVTAPAAAGPGTTTTSAATTTTTRATTTTTRATTTTTRATTTTTLATTTTSATTTTTSDPPSTTSTTESPATTTTAALLVAAPGVATTTAAAPASPADGVWLELRECESGDNYQADTGNGYYGAYQFSPSTWSDLGYPGRPDEEPYWMQDEAAQRLEATQGWAQWPSCSAALGL